MKRKITIESLARMTQDEFSVIGERFDKVDARFEKIDHALKNILDVVLEIPSKKSFEHLEAKVQTIDTRLASVKRRVRK